MIIPIYLCDDVPELLEQYGKIILNTITIQEYPMRIVGTFTKPNELLDEVKQQIKSGNDYGIYFLDIDLKAEADGFELAKQIRKIDTRCFIVFITTFGNLASETFRQHIEAMDYIVKDDVENVYDRIIECLKYANERKLNLTHDPCICIESLNIKYYYNESDIICIRSLKKAHRLEIITHKKSHTLRANLKDILPKLSNDFVYCHRSAIVNKKHISSIDYTNRLIHMSNSIVIEASASGIKKLA